MGDDAGKAGLDQASEVFVGCCQEVGALLGGVAAPRHVPAGEGGAAAARAVGLRIPHPPPLGLMVVLLTVQGVPMCQGGLLEAGPSFGVRGRQVSEAAPRGAGLRSVAAEALRRARPRRFPPLLGRDRRQVVQHGGGLGLLVGGEARKVPLGGAWEGAAALAQPRPMAAQVGAVAVVAPQRLLQRTKARGAIEHVATHQLWACLASLQNGLSRDLALRIVGPEACAPHQLRHNPSHVLVRLPVALRECSGP